MKNARVWLKKSIAEEDARRSDDPTAPYESAADLGQPTPDPAPPAERSPLAIWREKFARANGKLTCLARGIATLTGESAHEIAAAYLTALAARVAELPTEQTVERFVHWTGTADAQALTTHPAWPAVLAAIEARRAELTAREPGEEG